jgi:hypothetical protein
MSNPTYQPPDQEHPFACYIRILGKGKSGSRSLSQAGELWQQRDLSRLP